MDKRRIPYITLGFCLLMVVVVVLLAWGGRRQSGGIVLPVSPSDSAGLGSEEQGSRLRTVSITPETVKPAISTLTRPAAYSRTQVVETFWKGGSGQSSTQVYVSGSRTRMDTAQPDGSVRHTLAQGDAAGVWYDDETHWVRLQAPSFSADRGGRMLTYETVMDLPVEAIAQADYRELEGNWCVYVETAPDKEDYVDRYWISVNNGLLVLAERLCGEDLVYRFTAGAPEIAAQAETLFLLPDGSTLTENAA